MNRTFNFTKKLIEALPSPSTGKTYYKDTQEKGLSLYVTANGVKTFYVRKRINGRDERIVLGNFPDLTIARAREKALLAKAQVVEGENPNDAKRSLRQETTLEELFKLYMERYSTREKKSWMFDQREIPTYLGHWFKRKISSITTHEIRELHRSLEARKFKVNGKPRGGSYQANRVLERIRAMYNKAIEWGWQGTNPTAGIRKYKEKSRDRFLQPGEIPCFFKALEAEPNDTARDYILLSLLTGARKGNMLTMRWEEIDFHREVWRIPETKNGESLEVPLIAAAMEVLQRRRKENMQRKVASVYVFPGTGKQGYFHDPKKAWLRVRQTASLLYWQQDRVLAALIEEAERVMPIGYNQFTKVTKLAHKKGVKLPTALMDIRLHDLRRSLGSWQAATGATTAIIGKTLGHKNSLSTAIYERLNIDPVRVSVQTATDEILRLGGYADRGVEAMV